MTEVASRASARESAFFCCASLERLRSRIARELVVRRNSLVPVYTFYLSPQDCGTIALLDLTGYESRCRKPCSTLRDTVGDGR
jgi:hypothetical protein